MITLFQAKELSIADTPLLLFDCTYADGKTVDHWCTHAVTVNQIAYLPRVLKQNVFQSQIGSDLGVDLIPQITLELANVDSYFSEIQQSVGIKGSQLTVSMVFYNFPSNAPSSDVQVLFKGLLNPPDQVTEELFRVSATNRLSLQRVVLPPVRIQKRCPWNFPQTLEQRMEAVTGGTAGVNSRFYRCGYSPDVTGGVGNNDVTGTPFTTCSYTRTDCTARGMFSADSLLRPTARFGGIEFVPSTIVVRSTGEKGDHYSPLLDNEARYNDFVPLIYGTAWFSPDIVFARNDGNLTHFEVLLGMGPIDSIQSVLVNQIEIPQGQAGKNLTGTGWYNLVSRGTRNGTFNLDFTDAHGNPLGDPYGSMAYLSVVVPNSINDGSTLPQIQVLLNGLQVEQFAQNGSSLGVTFSNNPAWIIVDILLRIGWSLDELDMSSILATASYCAESLQTTDLFGNPITTPRFQCNLVLKSKRAASDVIRGVRNCSRLFLRYGQNGTLQLIVENSIALQQPSPIANSNATDSLNGGWPAYEFGDGTNGTTGIARTSSRASSVKLSSKSNADTPNRFAAEFQDAFNEYQQDSFSIVDVDDVAATGQEITAAMPVLGLPHFDQAARVLTFNLQKSVAGNTTIEFQTSAKALGLSCGDIITITYLKENYERQPFRITKLQPGENYRTATLTAQIHNDSWYYDTNGQTSADSSRRQVDYSLNLPRPLGGVVPDANGVLQFGVSESVTQAPDGTATVTATVSFAAPSPVTYGSPDIPLISLVATVSTSGGTLPGGQNLYYAISSVGADGSESGLSFLVHPSLPAGTNSYTVTLTGLSFPSLAKSFHVYRGSTPSNLLRIASNVLLTTTFEDTGIPQMPVLPPDPNYDHSDFFWRLELSPPVNATVFTGTTIGSNLLEMIPSSYVGMVVRIVFGTGGAQEGTIVANTANLLTISAAWSIVPDATSQFVIAQGTYQFGALAQQSPVQFTIPNRAGNVIHLSGRSANANGMEAPYEVSPVTRWEIGGAGIKNVDAAIAPAPSFAVGVPDDAGGDILFSPPTFRDFTNLSTVTAGTYTLHYLDELNIKSVGTLTANLAQTGSQLTVTPAFSGSLPAYILIDAEVLEATAVDNTGGILTITRALHGTTAAAHNLGTTILGLEQQVFVVPFAKNFFGSPASGSWSYPVSFPNARIVSAEMTVTNSQGTSPSNSINFANLVGNGLRTLSGSQFSFQIPGYLAVQSGAAPAIIVDAPRVVRDVYAVVTQAPIGGPIGITLRLNGAVYAILSIAASATAVDMPTDGTELAPMNYQDRLTIDITSVGTTVPGSDLTVIIRV